MSSPKQTVQSKHLLEPAVVSALSDEGDSGNEHDGNQTNSDATVRPVTLPEGWTLVLNSLRQVCVLPREVRYCMFPDARESRVTGRSENLRMGQALDLAI